MAEYDDCVEKKIAKLIEEGKERDQAVAMAHSMCEQDKKVIDEKYATRYSQAEVHYTPDYTGEGGHCAGCRWFASLDEYDRCVLVSSYPHDILPTGRCDKHEPIPVMEPEPMPVTIVEANAGVGKTASDVQTIPVPQVDPQTSFLSHFKATITEALRGKANLPVAFKVVGNHWFARWSNTFKDRDGEHFATKAHDDYLLRVKMGVVPMPRLWVDHIPGSDHGTARVMARIGHFTIAAGEFDETPKGRAARTYYERHAAKGVSHGFAYDKAQLIDGVYHQYNTFEISPLMRKTPANPFTTFDEVQSMKITEQDIKLLKEMFGEDIVNNEIIAKTEQASKALEEAGVAYKDFIDPQPDPAPASEAVKNTEKDFAGLILNLIEDHAGAVTVIDAMGKAIKARDEKTAELIEGLKKDFDALKTQFDQRPRIASKDDETKVDKKDVNPAIIEQMEQLTTDSFYGTKVQGN